MLFLHKVCWATQEKINQAKLFLFKGASLRSDSVLTLALFLFFEGLAIAPNGVYPFVFVSSLHLENKMASTVLSCISLIPVHIDVKVVKCLCCSFLNCLATSPDLTVWNMARMFQMLILEIFIGTGSLGFSWPRFFPSEFHHLFDRGPLLSMKG